MLILPPGHAQSLRTGGSLSAREKWILRGVIATVVAIAIAVAISLATAGKSSSHGCIYATIPGVVGAQQVDQCGASARETCASARRPGAFTPQAADVVVAACRRAGLPVKR